MRQSSRQLPPPRPATSDEGEEASGGGGGGGNRFPQVTRHRSLLTGATVPTAVSQAEPPDRAEPQKRSGGGGGGVVHRRTQLAGVGANLSGTKFDIIHEAVERLGLTVCPDDDFATPYLIWNDLSVPIERVSELKPHQRINHFPGMSEISRKDLLSRNMARLSRLLPQEYSFAPRTWCLPGEYGQFIQHAREQRKAGKSRSFIYKPANGAMGHGIRIFKNADLVPCSPEAAAIVQEYIAKPLLIDGFKCDLRIYVLVTSCDPLRVYFYNDGLLRLSTEKYVDPQKCDTDTLYMHLTNYSINKHSENYAKGDDDSTGSKRSIRFLNEYLQKRNYDVQLMWRSIVDLLVKTMLAAEPQLLQNYRMCRPASPPGSDSVCFEVLGFDVLLDHKLKPWLLEVNRSPSFGAEQNIDRRVKLGMLDEALRLLNIRASDRARHASEQKAQAQRRLMRGRSEQREAVEQHGDSGERRRREREQQLARRREDLLAQLARVRREADREEHEIRTCRRFRRIFPGEDRVKHERYVDILMTIFATSMPNRSGTAPKELAAQYANERTRQEELMDQLARCDAQLQAELAERPQRTARQQQRQQRRSQQQLPPLPLPGGGSAEVSSSEGENDGENDDENVVEASENVGNGAGEGTELADSEEGCDAEASVESGRRPLSTSVASLLPAVPATAGAGQLTRRHTVVTEQRRASGLQTDRADAAADPHEAEQLNRRMLSQLNELCIRFPGKSTNQAEEVLAGLRLNWRLNKALVANYWLVKLDIEDRRKIVNIVRDHVRSAFQRCYRVIDVEEVRLGRTLSRVFARLLASSGQGLWATFSNFASWEAALIGMREPPSHTEIKCCRRVVQLCQDCLLTVFLFSGRPDGGSDVGSVSAEATGGIQHQRPVMLIGSTPRASLR